MENIKFNILKYKKEFIVAIMIVVVLSPIIFFSTKSITKDNHSDNTVSLQNHIVTKSLSVDGEVVANDVVDVKSDITGKITKIFVDDGDKVEMGKLLFIIDNATQQAAVTQALGNLQAARARVNLAQANLDKLLNGATDNDVNLIKSKEESAKTAFDSSILSAKDTLQKAYASSVTDISLNTDSLFNNPNTVNPTIKFNSTNYSNKVHVQNMRVNVGDILDRHMTADAYNLTDPELATELNRTKSELLQLREFTDLLLDVLDGAVESNGVTSTAISGYITSVSSARADIISNINAITGAISAINIAEQNVLIAQSSTDKVVAKSREEDIKAAEANLDSAKAGVTQALGAYQSAKAMLDKTYVYAPTSGVVADVYKDVGELATPQESILRINSNDMYISILIPEVDLEKVHTGVKAYMIFDAFKNRKISGVLKYIYPNKIEKAGIVYYEGRIIIENTQDVDDLILLPGMSLDAYLLYKNTSPVPSLPRDAVLNIEDKYYVSLLKDNGEIIKKEITVGILGDEYVEVISGLIPEDKVIIDK